MKRPIVISLLGIALAFVCLGIGAVILFGLDVGFPANDPFNVRNISSELEESKTLKVDVDEPVSLRIDNAAGEVSITGAKVETVQVRVVKTAYESTQERADREVESIKYTIEQTGNTVTIKYELPKSMNLNNKINTVDFFVTVPTTTTASIDGSFGDISVTDISGNVDIANEFGAVTVENVEGALSVSNDSGEVNAQSIKAGNGEIDLNSEFGSITLQNANGKDVTLTSNSGRIILDDVRATGDVTTNTDFGDTTFENGSGDSLSIETNSGRVFLAKIRISGELKVQDDFGEIELNQVSASSYDLHTNSGSIAADGAKGKLKAYTDFGSINVTNAESVTLDLKTSSGSVEFSGSLGAGPHLVDTDFGEIVLTLPADSKLDVDLSTDFGTIKSDLPITVTLNGDSNSDGDQVVGSINGGGDQFTAQTSSGSVTIHANQ
jgi:DUF4097 and DUF4098 domain-containing protein YvlB